MNTQDLYDRFRSEVADAKRPYLWSDDEVYQYMDDAQKLFCRLGGGIPDGTTDDITLFDVAVGDTWLDLDPSIIKLRSAQRLSDFKDLPLLNFEDLQNNARPTGNWDYGVQQTFQLNDTIGDLHYLVLGITEDKARLLNRPQVADQIRLIVERMPLTTLSTEEAPQDFEIRQEHVPYLLLWMKHRAYAKQDAETFDGAASDKFEAEFRAYCKQAREEKERRQHKYRAMVYGGI